MFVYVGTFLLVGSLRAGSQVFALPMLFLCLIWHTMWLDKSQQLLCMLLLLFAMIKSVVKSFKVPVIEVAEITNRFHLILP